MPELASRYRYGTIVGDALDVTNGCETWEAELIGPASGSREMSVTLSQLTEPAERVVASAGERSLFVLDGAVQLTASERTVSLRRGAYALTQEGERYALRPLGAAPARIVTMHAIRRAGTGTDQGDLQARVAYGEFSEAMLMPSSTHAADGYTPDELPGVSLAWLVDAALGARKQTLFIVRYEPGGSMAPHRHPYEEFYLVLDGEVQATADGETRRLGPGDYLWAAIGCIHAFTNDRGTPVSWLETQAPQPPRERPVEFV